MKKIIYGILAISFIGIMGCGNDAQKEARERREKKMAEKAAEKEAFVAASERIALDNKGVGPIQSVDISGAIDEEMVTRGQEQFKTKCSACHKISKKFIGPSPKGIFERRSPEWVMNMILDPEGMTQNDPLAKDLLIEFNGSPMANQGLTEEQARDIIEYFRTLE